MSHEKELTIAAEEPICVKTILVLEHKRKRSVALDPYGILSGARDGQISISTLVRRGLTKRSMPTGLESTK